MAGHSDMDDALVAAQSLRKDIVGYKSRIESLQGELALKARRITELERENSSAKDVDRGLLESRLRSEFARELNDKADKHRAEMANITEQRDAARRTVANKEQLLAELQQKMACGAEQKMAAERKAQLLGIETKQLQDREHQHQQRQQEMFNQLDRYSAAAKEAQQRAEDAKGTEESLKMKLEQLTLVVGGHAATSRDYRELMEKQRRELEKMALCVVEERAERDALKQQLSERDAELAAAAEAKKLLSEQVQQLKTDAIALDDSLRQAQQLANVALTRAAQTEDRMHAARREVASAVDEGQPREGQQPLTDNEDSHPRVAHLLEELRSARKEAADSAAEAAAVKRRYEDVARAAETRKSELIVLRDTVAKLSQDLAAATEQATAGKQTDSGSSGGAGPPGLCIDNERRILTLSQQLQRHANVIRQMEKTQKAQVAARRELAGRLESSQQAVQQYKQEASAARAQAQRYSCSPVSGSAAAPSAPARPHYAPARPPQFAEAAQPAPQQHLSSGAAQQPPRRSVTFGDVTVFPPTPVPGTTPQQDLQQQQQQQQQRQPRAQLAFAQRPGADDSQGQGRPQPAADAHSTTLKPAPRSSVLPPPQVRQPEWESDTQQQEDAVAAELSRRYMPGGATTSRPSAGSPKRRRVTGVQSVMRQQ